VYGLAGAQHGGSWRELEPGLELARFSTAAREAAAEGDLIVLRVDPGLWDLRVLARDRGLEDRSRTVRSWCEDFGLVAAVNAGMYQADRRTHVGYCKVAGRMANPSANDYLSALALNPVDPTDPPFRIFDLDEEPLAGVTARYHTVVQNLRLIKRSGENRWQPSDERWQEAALGEDWQGRALLIYCGTPRSMAEFNEILLELPLGLVAAQHLEGNAPARLWVQHSGLPADDPFQGNNVGQLLPNILGVARRHPQIESE